MSGQKKARNLLSALAPKFSEAPVLMFNQHDYTRHWHSTLRLAYANQNSPVESLAADAGCSIPTAKKWWGGETTPSGRYLLNLMARRPDIAAEVRRLTTMEAEHDPDFQKALCAFYQLLTKVRA